jgi:hypothetical protein
VLTASVQRRGFLMYSSETASGARKDRLRPRFPRLEPNRKRGNALKIESGPSRRGEVSSGTLRPGCEASGGRLRAVGFGRSASVARRSALRQIRSNRSVGCSAVVGRVGARPVNLAPQLSLSVRFCYDDLLIVRHTAISLPRLPRSRNIVLEGAARFCLDTVHQPNKWCGLNVLPEELAWWRQV